ncbi:hypothetical protein [Methylobacterium nodulans]|uniref:Uncharacterized protein n=1 Tax=Methylobacterium nodulans (strain LMG 21967 / CNCM I-2342 / ORS 2060) TaxID=460265 RepID=B8IXU9_METNO|nr:hypothetical protein [Methylobacterium nodulans]ACL63239.1 hypothetical protein Mnod_8778 [Methylobacterium nodulans ORS 2060]
MLTYGQMEEVLARVHGVQDVQDTTFRARMKHLSKLGIPVDFKTGEYLKPGKGKRLEYKWSEIFQFVFCLECYQFGLDATWFTNVIKQYGGSINTHLSRITFSLAKSYDIKDEYLVLVPSMMTWSFRKTEDVRFGSDTMQLMYKDDFIKLISENIADRRRICSLNVTETLRLVLEAKKEVVAEAGIGADAGERKAKAV